MVDGIMSIVIMGGMLLWRVCRVWLADMPRRAH